MVTLGNLARTICRCCLLLLAAFGGAVLVTNSYYYFYSRCSGLWSGEAFGLTIVVLPAVAASALVLGLLARRLSGGNGLLAQALAMLSVFAIAFTVLMATHFPVAGSAVLGDCPAWLVSG